MSLRLDLLIDSTTEKTPLSTIHHPEHRRFPSTTFSPINAPSPLLLTRAQLSTLSSYGSFTFRSILPTSAWSVCSFLLCLGMFCGLGFVALTGVPLKVGDIIGGRRRVVAYWIVVGDLQIGVGTWGWGVNESWTNSSPFKPLPYIIKDIEIPHVIRVLKCWPAIVNISVIIVLAFTTMRYHTKTTRHRLSSTDPLQSRSAALGMLCSMVTLLEAAIGMGMGWGKQQGDVKVEIGLGLGLGPLSLIMSGLWLVLQQIRHHRAIAHQRSVAGKIIKFENHEKEWLTIEERESDDDIDFCFSPDNIEKV